MGSFKEEFMRTESTLARHQAAINERLIDAAIVGIAHLASNKRELEKMPEELRSDFLQFMDDLTKAGVRAEGGGGSIHNTVSQMSVGEAQIMVDRFLAMAYEVEKIRHREMNR